jgi:hypothetical protein
MSFSSKTHSKEVTIEVYPFIENFRVVDGSVASARCHLWRDSLQHVTQEQDVLPRESLPQVWLEVDGLSGGPLFEAFYRLCLVDGDIIGFRVSGNLLYKGNRISLLE